MKNLLKKIPGYRIIKKFRMYFIFLIIFTFGAIVFEMLSIGAIIPLMNSVLVDGAPDVSRGWIVDNLIEILKANSFHSLFVTICIFYLIVTLFKVALKVLRDVLKTVLNQRIFINCQKEIFQKNIYSDLSFFIKNKSGDLIFRAINLPREVSQVFKLAPSLFIESVTVLVLCVLLVTVSYKLFAGVIIVGFFYGKVIKALSKNVLETVGKEAPKILANQNIIVSESVGGIREIISYGKRKSWLKRFSEQCDRFYHLKIRVTVLRMLPGNTLELFIVGGMGLVGAYYGINHEETLLEVFPVFAVFALALVRMLLSFSKIGQDRIQLASLVPSLEIYEGLMKEETVVKKENGKVFETFISDIVFENVTFSYVKKENVLKNINLKIKKNETFAIVGGSGGGKTTLIDLLLGLYPLNGGRILVDGVDLNEYLGKSWREHIGVVSQNSFIFNASAKENIAFDFRNIDMEKVISSAKAAGAHEFISKLKNGYDAELGDRGYALSGGQRQRISIARALYRDPEIIIFDEATSALDSRTENLITETISNLSRRKTLIILSHRLSTIEKADMIYVLKHGCVSEQGTHEQLLNRAGEYRELYKKQCS